MLNCLKNQWPENGSRFLFESVPTELVRPQAAAETAMAEFQKKTDIVAGDKDKTWQAIAVKHGPDPFRKRMAAFVTATWPAEVKLDTKASLVDTSVARFMPVFHNIETKFFYEAADLEGARNNALKNIETTTRDGLADLREQLEAALPAARKPSETLKGMGETLSKDNVREMRQNFDRFGDALNSRYLGKKEFHIPIIVPDLDKKSSDIEEFRVNMKGWVMAQFDHLASTGKANPDELKKLEQKIEKKYAEYAGMDKKPEDISPADLMQMAGLIGSGLDMPQVIRLKTDAEGIRMMEAIFLLNRDAWKQIKDNSVELIIKEARENGAEGVFIEKANALKKAEEGPKAKPIEGFGDAVDYFGKKAEEFSDLGAEETFRLLIDFSAALKNPFLEKLGDIKPPNMRILILREREFLVGNPPRTVPPSERDILLVEFIRAGREEREIMLRKNPDELFRAIKNIQTHYKKPYDDASRNLKDTLRLNPTDLEDETPHLKAARLKALMLLADEAAWIIGNYSSSKEFSGIKKKLDETPADANPVTPGLGFKDTWKRAGIPQEYIPNMELQGFSVGGLAKTGVKIFAAFTILANVLNSVRGLKSETIGEKIGEALGKMTRNPYIWGGAGAFWVAGESQRTPEILDYLKKGEFERGIIANTVKLKGIAEKTKSGSLRAFIQNEAEWGAMKSLKPNDYKWLVEKADELDPRNPMVSVNDLERRGLQKSVTVPLGDSPALARVRYRFYKKFLAGESKTNLDDLQDMCNKASF